MWLGLIIQHLINGKRITDINNTYESEHICNTIDAEYEHIEYVTELINENGCNIFRWSNGERPCKFAYNFGRLNVELFIGSEETVNNISEPLYFSVKRSEIKIKQHIMRQDLICWYSAELEMK